MIACASDSPTRATSGSVNVTHGIVGATVAAPGGGEAIAELTVWVSQGARIDAVSRSVHAYPTLAEGPARAADEHVAARYSSPRVRAAARPLLAIFRAVERPR